VSDKILVQRRFPTYDFSLEISLSATEASKRLDEYLSHQERPKGFVLSDPRVDGNVSGSTFALRRRQSGFGGSVSPYAEGYFVPEGSRSRAYVRVQIPLWWWLFDVALLIGVLVSFEFSFGWPMVGALVLLGAFTLLLSAGPIWVEASQLKALLEKVFAEGRPSNST
jgi:hypothetical protein